ncbi:MAG: SCO family protein [Rhodospirillaceae bacterium]|jgi:protein SCO1/2|nr:SCO family protein [Rhodospirillaceae bacterium]MBT3494581.1 SCO family protein [Rhodospirillaceae bacterium]MBT3782640.1 SCO family protein [Rhodospirillaceae bacterium]MBT3974887.1 SCO family protein [Rhodospirillaceae bacterium]MBT4171417.1 SCO family protein [Rhodospirillaceae bacterium]
MTVRAILTAGMAMLAMTAAVLPRATAATSSGPATTILDEQGALAFSQAALGTQIENYRFVDGDGKTVHLADYRGKPLIVNLVYTACIRSCPVIVQTLNDAVADAQGALDADRFNIITVGFDTRSDTPDRMRSFARSQGINLPNWRFLSSDGRTIERLAKQLGFVYYASAEGFQHLSQVSILDSQGVLYRQVYGEYFDSPFLVEPLKDLVFGRNSDPLSVEGLVNRLRLFCTLYDPAAQRYRFDYSVFIGLTIGLAALLIVGSVLVRNIWRRRNGVWLSIRH